MIDATELVRNFAAALNGLVPFGRDLGLAWRAGQAYDDWDAVARSLFGWLVELPLAERLVPNASGSVRFAPYGLAQVDLAKCYRLDVLDASSGRLLGRFVELDASASLFDTVVFEEYGASQGAAHQGPLPKRELESVRFVVRSGS